MNYYYETKSKDRRLFEDNKGTVSDTEEMNDVPSWELDGGPAFNTMEA